MQAVIFDFDYTLGDSTRGIEISINYALQKLGYSEKGNDEIRRTIGLSLKDTFTRLTQIDNKSEASQFAAYFKEKADTVMVENTELYEPTIEVLRNIKKQGCKIGIVTTKFHYRIEQILDKFHVKDMIDIIIGAEDVKEEKPNPEGLLLAIEKLEASKEDVLYVGDSIVDAETAYRAHVNFVGVLTGTTSAQEFSRFNNIYIGENLYEIYNSIFS